VSALRPALALVVVIAIGCAPSLPSAASPTRSVASSSPTPVPTASASPSLPARLVPSNLPLPAVAGAFVLFQLPGETGLHGISFGGEANGLLGAEAPQVSARASWSQSPYGFPYIVGTKAYGRDGKELGAIPWSEKESKTWSSDGRFLCAAVPERAAAGAQMRLEMAFIGQATRAVASGFTTYSDNAGYPVLACDEGTDRAIVAVFGQGIAPARAWIFKLSTGALIRSVDYTAAMASGGWVTASADGSLLAETVRSGGAGGPWKATIRSTDDGAQLGTVDGFVVRGFSGDKANAIVANEISTAVIDWKTGRTVWSINGPYGGYLPEPAGPRVAIGVGFTGGTDQRDVYLVGPSGFIKLLPEFIRIALR
jgi:hypothetical protein